MGMPAQKTDWTAELVRALPDDRRRYEVLDGELFISAGFTMAHQRAVGELFITLHRYLSEHGIGEAMPSPSDLEFSPSRMLQPDVFAYELVPGTRPRAWADVMSLILAVEITSPETAHVDRQTMRRIYQGERVTEYWIVDLDSRLVERWRPDDDRPEIRPDILEWQPKAGIPPLRLELEEIFGPPARAESLTYRKRRPTIRLRKDYEPSRRAR
jgi:Uma2 family endonuclease